MEHLEDVKAFFDYLVMDDDGWRGVRDDAPEEAKRAYEAYMARKRQLAERGAKV